MDSGTKIGIVIGIVVGVLFSGILAYIWAVKYPELRAYDDETRRIFKEHCKDKAFFDKNGGGCSYWHVEPEVGKSQ